MLLLYLIQNIGKKMKKTSCLISSVLITILLLCSCSNKADLLYAQSIYEVHAPGYESIDRKAPAPLKKIPTSRYQLSETQGYINAKAKKGNKASLMFVGDLMCQGRQQNRAKQNGIYNFNKSFDYVKPLFQKADFIMGNLETTLSQSAPYMGEVKEVDNKPHCNAPATFLDALKYAGFDAVGTANNHACDAGVKGIYETLEHIQNYGFIQTGTYNNANAQRFIIVNVKGIKIAIMSYATYFNTKDKNLTTSGRKILLNKYSYERCKKDVTDAKALGAEFIFAYNHWGKEHTYEITEKQKRYAQEMADAGIDYILGSHSHCLQPYNLLTAKDGRKVPVIYSLGNFTSHMKKEINKDTIILSVNLTRNVDGKVIVEQEGYIPCRIFTQFRNVYYQVIPANGQVNSSYLTLSKHRIQKVIGNQLKMLP